MIKNIANTTKEIYKLCIDFFEGLCMKIHPKDKTLSDVGNFQNEEESVTGGISCQLTYKIISTATSGTPQGNMFLYIKEKVPQYLTKLDKGFLTQLKGNSFHDRYCEFLMCSLLSENCKAKVEKPVTKKNTNNYDFDVTVDGITFAVEVTNVNNSTNPNEMVPHTIINQPGNGAAISSGGFCDDKIQLRISSRVSDKLDHYKKCREANNIATDKPYVLAIGIYGLPNSSAQVNMFFSIPAHYLGAFFPIGDPIVYFEDTHSMSPPSDDPKTIHYPTVTVKEYNVKANLAEVSKNIFLDQKYENISAVLLSSRADGLIMMQYEPGKLLYNDFILIHNPLAKNKLPQGLLPVFSEHITSINIRTIQK